MAVDQADLMGSLQTQGGSVDEATPYAGHAHQCGPLRTRQTRKPFLKSRGTVADVEDLESSRDIGMLNRGRLAKTLTEFVGVGRVSHLRFRQMAQQGLLAPAGIKDAID